MQVITAIQRLLKFVMAHPKIFVGLAVAILLYFLTLFFAWLKRGPGDTTGNGITVGQAKAFDNRSLALRVERLSASLDALKVINKNVTDNVSTFQKHTTTETSRSVTLDVKPNPIQTDGQSKNKEETNPTKADAKSGEATTSETKPTVALAASDILTDQLNLASQILNLETLYERSLTDRLLEKETRLQTVLGFQVSINPPAGCEDCVAIVEVAVRLEGSESPVSLVALIPQEKTYNAQTVSSSAKSIGGSAVASVLTLGFTSKGESRELFIHRDSDTIAFERDPRSKPTLFKESNTATVFGWEFRPVLGRRAVSGGTRQMLAVIALPKADGANEEAKVAIKTRSYWRRYDRAKQTSRGKWGWIPWRVDRSLTVDSDQQTLVIPNTRTIQEALAPKVTDIKWVNSGPNRATVIVKGANFFSGTKVVTGGKVHREEDASLTLKSDHALEFETTIDSLVNGDSVLSGRFGSSLQLTVDPGKRQVTSLEITEVNIERSGYTRASRISVDVKGLNKDGEDMDLTVEDIQKLPEPILFVGAEPVAMPYDYYDKSNGDSEDVTNDPNVPADKAAHEQMAEVGQPQELENITEEPPRKLKYIQVKAWIPKTLGRSQSVAFRIPFCGFEYQASVPLGFSEEPTITRLGADAANTVFRIAHPVRFLGGVTVELDQTYSSPPQLEKKSDSDYRFTVRTDTVSQYKNLIVRAGSVDSFVLAIPGEEKPKTKPAIDNSSPPQRLQKGSLGPIRWAGTELSAIETATFTSPTKDNQPKGVPAEFVVFDGGKKIEVHLQEGSTETPGRGQVEFTIAGGAPPIRVPLFIVKDASDTVSLSTVAPERSE